MDRHHPYWKKDPEFKYTYCFGLGVMSMGHMKSIMETQDFFEELMRSINLAKEQEQQIFFDLNNHFDEWVDHVFGMLQGKEEQYCFVFDLYSILSFASWAKEYCQAVLEDYLQVFQFSTAEREFFAAFDRCRQMGRVEAAVEVYRRFVEQGFRIRYDFLTWFFPMFHLEEQLEAMRIRDGETVILDYPVVIQGDIEVDKGGRLLIHGADIHMNGRVIVHGGRFVADHGHIEVMGCSAAYWLTIEESSVVTLTDTTVNCQEHCGMLHQTTGHLLIRECWICHTAGARAISFEGDAMKLADTHFCYGQGGMLSIEDVASAEIVDCTFKHAQAEYGGAVYADTIHDVLLRRCSFESCHAKYLAAAVYFKYQKLGQRIEECSCRDCTPQEHPFFNTL